MSFFDLLRNKLSKRLTVFLSIALFISFTGCAQIGSLNTIDSDAIPEREGISVFDSDFENYNDNVSKSNEDEKADEEARIRAEEEAKAKAEAEAKAKAEEEARKKAEEEAKAKAEAEAKAKAEEEARKKAEEEAKKAAAAGSSKRKYVLNNNTKKFHRPDCSSVKTIKPENYEEIYDSREAIIARGYDPCKKCNP
ncbi:MAG: hypothetical protein J5816_03720 [Clostridia bacterium]|nr:hypothetical protein [Clostridia bacterium]